MIDNRTSNLDFPLPDSANTLQDDVLRLRDALVAVDAAVFAKASPADIQAAIAALVGGAPVTLNTLGELAAAINNDPNFAASIAALLALKASTSDLEAESLARQQAIADLQASVIDHRKFKVVYANTLESL